MTASARPAALARRAGRLFGEVREALVQAGRSLLAHRLRSALTVGGVAIGIATVIAIWTAFAGLQANFARQLSNLGPNTLYVHKWQWGVDQKDWWKFRNRPKVTMLDYRALRSSLSLAEGVAPMVFNSASVTRGEKELKNIDLIGTTEPYLQAGGWQIRRGRFISDIDGELGTDICVIGADLEDAFFKAGGALGSTLKVGPLLRCTVVGTLVRKGTQFGHSLDARIIVPISTFERSFGSQRGLTLAVVAPAGKLRETEDEVIAAMRVARRLLPDQEDNFSVNRQDKLAQGFNQLTFALGAVGLLVGIITAIVGGIGIMNILLVSVKERTREIGVRRALGARRSTILLQFLSEAIMVSLLGGALGVALGVGGAELADLLTPVPASVNPFVVLGGVVGSVLLGATFGLWPALSAAFLHPIEALRYE